MQYSARNCSIQAITCSDERCFRTDPGGFVDGYPYPLMTDEVQRGCNHRYGETGSTITGERSSNAT
jgi:hypothetical protein